jgi:hydroxyacylglutathione hydrolase
MKIERIPALADNYIFLLWDEVQRIAAVVDPAEAQPVLKELKEKQLKLVAIFNTHHHGDHVGGNRRLIAEYPNVCVYGGEKDRGRIPGQEVYLQEGDTVEFAGREAKIFFIPGHTSGHIAYYFPPVAAATTGELFCGDTIFAGGCGRLFEGTPAQMVDSIGKLRQLPDNTLIWCAHEYTLSNLKFALSVDGDNQVLKERWESVKRDRSFNIPTVPSLLGIEKQTNPFLRWDTPTLQAITGMSEPARVFGKIRGMKDNF